MIKEKNLDLEMNLHEKLAIYNHILLQEIIATRLNLTKNINNEAQCFLNHDNFLLTDRILQLEFKKYGDLDEKMQADFFLNVNADIPISFRLKSNNDCEKKIHESIVSQKEFQEINTIETNILKYYKNKAINGELFSSFSVQVKMIFKILL